MNGITPTNSPTPQGINKNLFSQFNNAQKLLGGDNNSKGDSVELSNKQQTTPPTNNSSANSSNNANQQAQQNSMEEIQKMLGQNGNNQQANQPQVTPQNSTQTNQQTLPQNQQQEILNPPDIGKNQGEDIINQQNNNPQQTNQPKNLTDNIKTALKDPMVQMMALAGTATVAAAFLFRGNIPGLKKEMSVISDISGLKKYLKELPNIGKKQTQKIKISLAPENYQKGYTQKSIVDLSSKEIRELKNNPERLQDIKKSINGSLQAVKGSPKQEKIRIILGENTPKGGRKTLTNLLEKQGRINDSDIVKHANILKEVQSVETKKANSANLLGIKNPFPIEITKYKYVKTGNESPLSKLHRWVSEHW